MKTIRRLLLLAGLISSLMTASFSFASGNTLSELLALPKTPDGVVIEIVTGDAAGLSWALPRAQDAVKQLRAKFPKLSIAIVTHGKEQFALTRKGSGKYSKEHDMVKQLQKDAGVQLHVCGTYAEWNKVTPEDFPDYVDVSAAGPAQINDYMKLGYLLLVIDGQ